MQYFVIGDQGQKYGPADVTTLNQWAQEGRLQPYTILEDSRTAARIQASAVPGIMFGPDFRTATQGGIGGVYGNPPGTAPGAPPGAYGYQQNPYANPNANYPRQPFGAQDDGSKDVTYAWIFGTIGLVTCSAIIFSSLGIYFANLAVRKGNPSGQAAMNFCIATLVLGTGCCAGLNMFLR
jgi:hypothetical protein